jgi:hypothetical protein
MRDEDLFCLKKVRTVDAAKYLQDGTTAAELRLLIQEHRCPFADVDLTPGSHRRRYRINVGRLIDCKAGKFGHDWRKKIWV